MQNRKCGSYSYPIGYTQHDYFKLGIKNALLLLFYLVDDNVVSVQRDLPRVLQMIVLNTTHQSTKPFHAQINKS